MHPDQLMDQLTSAQYSEWMAFDQLEPIGSWWQDFRMSYLCALMGNVYREKGSKAFTIFDFMPPSQREELEHKEPPQSWEQIKETFMSIAKAQNKRIKSNSKPPKTKRQ